MQVDPGSKPLIRIENNFLQAPAAVIQEVTKLALPAYVNSPDGCRELFAQAKVTDEQGVIYPEVAGVPLPDANLNFIASFVRRKFDVANLGFLLGFQADAPELLEALSERCKTHKISFGAFYTIGSLAKQSYKSLDLLAIARSLLEKVLGPTMADAFYKRLDTPAFRFCLDAQQNRPLPDVDTVVYLNVAQEQPILPLLQIVKREIVAFYHEKMPPLTAERREHAAELLRRRYPTEPELWLHPHSPEFSKIVVEYLAFVKFSLIEEEEMLILSLSDPHGFRLEITFRRPIHREIFPSISVNSTEVLTSAGPYFSRAPEGPNKVQCIVNMLNGCELPGCHKDNENFFKTMVTHMTQGVYCPDKGQERSQVSEAKAAAKNNGHHIVQNLLIRTIPHKQIFPYFIAEIMRRSIHTHLFGDPLAAIACTFNTLTTLEGVATPEELEIVLQQMKTRWQARLLKSSAPHPLLAIGTLLSHPQGTIQHRLALIKFCLFIAAQASHTATYRNQQGAQLVEAKTLLHGTTYSLMANVQGRGKAFWFVQDYFKLNLDPHLLKFVDYLIVALWPPKAIARSAESLPNIQDSLNSKVPQESLLGLLLSFCTHNADIDPIFYLPKVMANYPHLAQSLLFHYQNINTAQFPLDSLSAILEQKLSPDILEVKLLDCVFKILLEKQEAHALLKTLFEKVILPNPNIFREKKREYAKQYIQRTLPHLALTCMDLSLREHLISFQDELDLVGNLLTAWCKMADAQRLLHIADLERVVNQLLVVDTLGMNRELAIKFYNAFQLIPVQVRPHTLHKLCQDLEASVKSKAAGPAQVAPPVAKPPQVVTLHAKVKPPLHTPPAPPPPQKAPDPNQEKIEKILSQANASQHGKVLIELLVKYYFSIDYCQRFVDKCLPKRVDAAIAFLITPDIMGRLKNQKVYPQILVPVLVAAMQNNSLTTPVSTAFCSLLQDLERTTILEFPLDQLKVFIDLLLQLTKKNQLTPVLKELILSKVKYIIPVLQSQGLVVETLQVYCMLQLLANEETRKNYSRTLLHQLNEQNLSEEFIETHDESLRQIIDDSIIKKQSHSPAARLLRSMARKTRHLAHAERYVALLRKHCTLETADDFEWLLSIITRFRSQLTTNGVATLLSEFTGQIALPKESWQTFYREFFETCINEKQDLLALEVVRKSPFPPLRGTFVERVPPLLITLASHLRENELDAALQVADTYCPTDRTVWELLIAQIPRDKNGERQDRIWGFLERYGEPAEVTTLWLSALLGIDRFSDAKQKAIIESRDTLCTVAQEHLPSDRLLDVFKAIWSCWVNRLIQTHAKEMAHFASSWARACGPLMPSEHRFEFYLYVLQSLLIPLDEAKAWSFAECFQTMVREAQVTQGSAEATKTVLTSLQKKHAVHKCVEPLAYNLGIYLRKCQIPIETRFLLFSIYHPLLAAHTAIIGTHRLLIEGLDLLEEVLAQQQKVPVALLKVIKTIPVGEFLEKGTESETLSRAATLRLGMLLQKESIGLLVQPVPLAALTVRYVERMMGIAANATTLFLTRHRAFQGLSGERYKPLFLTFIDQMVDFHSVGADFVQQHAQALFDLVPKDSILSLYPMMLKHDRVKADNNLAVKLLPYIVAGAKNRKLGDKDLLLLEDRLIELIYQGAPIDPIIAFGEQIRFYHINLAVVCEMTKRMRDNALIDSYQVNYPSDIAHYNPVFQALSAHCAKGFVPHSDRQKLFLSLLKFFAPRDVNGTHDLIGTFVDPTVFRETDMLDNKRMFNVVELIQKTLEEIPLTNPEIADILIMFCEPKLLNRVPMHTKDKYIFYSTTVHKLWRLDPDRAPRYLANVPYIVQSLNEGTNDLESLKFLYQNYSEYLELLPATGILDHRSYVVSVCFNLLWKYFTKRKKMPLHPTERLEDESMVLKTQEFWKKFQLGDLMDTRDTGTNVYLVSFATYFGTISAIEPYDYHERLAKLMFPEDHPLRRPR